MKAMSVQDRLKHQKAALLKDLREALMELNKCA